SHFPPPADLLSKDRPCWLWLLLWRDPSRIHLFNCAIHLSTSRTSSLILSLISRLSPLLLPPAIRNILFLSNNPAISSSFLPPSFCRCSRSILSISFSAFKSL